MTTTFREQLGNAVAQRGESTLLHSQQSFQVYPGAMVLADLLLRDCNAAVGKGLDGFHPAATLHERLRLEMAVEQGVSTDFSESSEVWSLLCSLWVAADAPAVYLLDDYEVPQGTRRTLFLGALPAAPSLELARLVCLDESPLATLGISALQIADDEIALAPIARLAALDGPRVDGVLTLGLAGSPVRLIMVGGEQPIARIEIGFPWHRIPSGVAGGRGVLLEDVRGVRGVADFLFQQGIGRAVAAILSKIDAGAEMHGQPQVGFRQRVSTLWEEQALGPEDLLDAVADVLPNLAAQFVDANRLGHEITSLVLEQAIVDLVTRLKARPVLLRGAVEKALQRGLAPHVVASSGEVHWLPVGQYPESFPLESHDSRVLPSLFEGA